VIQWSYLKNKTQYYQNTTPSWLSKSTVFFSLEKIHAFQGVISSTSWVASCHTKLHESAKSWMITHSSPLKIGHSKRKFHLLPTIKVSGVNSLDLFSGVQFLLKSTFTSKNMFGRCLSFQPMVWVGGLGPGGGLDS